MMNRYLFFLIPVLFLDFSCTKKPPQGCFPNKNLPPHITPLTAFGERAEWSLDGNMVFFVDSAHGDVWKADLASGKTEKITRPDFRPPGYGYYRVLCLSNGDLLLTCGPERYKLYMQVMDKSLSKPPATIPDEMINEGPAISRKNLKIAWSPDHKTIYTGDIIYNKGKPEIINKKLIIDNRNVLVKGIKYEDILEPQNFRPPDEKELIWSQYGNDARGVFTSEVMGCMLETGELINYSNAPGQYDEPEGIFPDGGYTLVECDHHNPVGNSVIDIYKMKLDTADPVLTRLTFFSDVKGFRSSNPVVRDDGKMIAFQASTSGSAAGYGCGLYLFNLEIFKMD